MSALHHLPNGAVWPIAEIERRKAEITAIYADPSFFQRATRDQIDALVQEQEALGPKIERLVGEWEAIEREIELDQAAGSDLGRAAR